MSSGQRSMRREGREGERRKKRGWYGGEGKERTGKKG